MFLTGDYAVGTDKFSHISITSLADNFIRSEFAIPGTDGGKRRRRGELKSISNCIGSHLDASNVLFELSDGSLTHYSGSRSSFDTLPCSYYSNENRSCTSRKQLARVGKEGILVFMDASHDNNFGGRISLRLLEETGACDHTAFWGYYQIKECSNEQTSEEDTEVSTATSSNCSISLSSSTHGDKVISTFISPDHSLPVVSSPDRSRIDTISSPFTQILSSPTICSPHTEVSIDKSTFPSNEKSKSNVSTPPKSLKAYDERKEIIKTSILDRKPSHVTPKHTPEKLDSPHEANSTLKDVPVGLAALSPVDEEQIQHNFISLKKDSNPNSSAESGSKSNENKNKIEPAIGITEKDTKQIKSSNVKSIFNPVALFQDDRLPKKIPTPQEEIQSKSSVRSQVRTTISKNTSLEKSHEPAPTKANLIVVKDTTSSTKLKIGEPCEEKSKPQSSNISINTEHTKHRKFKSKDSVIVDSIQRKEHILTSNIDHVKSKLAKVHSFNILDTSNSLEDSIKKTIVRPVDKKLSKIKNSSTSSRIGQESLAREKENLTQTKSDTCGLSALLYAATFSKKYSKNVESDEKKNPSHKDEKMDAKLHIGSMKEKNTLSNVVVNSNKPSHEETNLPRLNVKPIQKDKMNDESISSSVDNKMMKHARKRSSLSSCENGRKSKLSKSSIIQLPRNNVGVDSRKGTTEKRNDNHDICDKLEGYDCKIIEDSEANTSVDSGLNCKCQFKSPSVNKSDN